MNRIMFVCHGNICRSPMAEFIFKKIVFENGMESEFEIASSATSNEEIWGSVGNPVYPPAKEILRLNGIFCDEKRARQLVSSDYDRYDLFIVMDENNLRNIRRIFSADPSKKICKLMDFTTQGGDVADPWYTNDFETAYRDILNGCKALFLKLK